MKYKVLKTRVILSLSKSQADRLLLICGEFMSSIEAAEAIKVWKKEYTLADMILSIDLDTYSGKTLQKIY